MILTLTSCNNDDNDTKPIDQLPPATQIGANTFGCLLDGEVFLPGDGQNPLDCVYEFANGVFNLGLQANKRNENNYVVWIGLKAKEFELEENQTYNLLEEGNPTNGYGVFGLAGSYSYTTQNYSGKLTITKLDLENKIISGTFFFDIQDFTGKIRKITEGRFDMQFRP
jgi:hypothetical protein